MSSFQSERAPEPRVIHDIRIGRVLVRVIEVVGPEGALTRCAAVRREHSGVEDPLVLERDELLLLGRALDQAHAFICKLDAAEPR